MRRRYYDYPFKNLPAVNGAIAGIAVSLVIGGLWFVFVLPVLQ